MNDSLSQSEENAIENEHLIQIQMLDLLGEVVTSPDADNDALKILEQLIDYSEIHFTSEQLVMRQHSYEDYDEHDGAHDALMERMKRLKEQVDSNPGALDQAAVNDLRSMLLGHIASHDYRLTQFLGQQKQKGF